MTRHIGGSILPSSDPHILRPIDCSAGILQVYAFAELDAHILTIDQPSGRSIVATHGNGYSCHKLAQHIAAGSVERAQAQAAYIQRCGGTTRDAEAIAFYATAGTAEPTKR